MTRASDDGGFTLVEALISLFVFSLVAAGSVLMLMQSVDTQNRVGEAQVALSEVQAARATLSADLAQYVPREVREANASVRPRFVGGDADMPLAFVRAGAEPDPDRGAVTTVALVEYRFAGGAIVRRSRQRLETGADGEAAERVLVADAGEPRFEFFDGVEWRREWLVGARGASPPRAVALIFTSRRYGEVRIEALVGLSG
jgi:type II secretion system protein J